MKSDTIGLLILWGVIGLVLSAITGWNFIISMIVIFIGMIGLILIVK